MIWGGRIQESELLQIESLAGHYATALEQRVLEHEPTSFADFLAWAHHCATAPEIRTRVGLFTIGFKPGWRDKQRRTWREKLLPVDHSWAQTQLSSRRFTPAQAATLQRAILNAARRSPHAKAKIIGALPIASHLAALLKISEGQR